MKAPWLPRRAARPARRASPEERRSRIAFGLAAALFAVVLLGGGASRTDVFSLLYLRPLTAIVLAVLLVMVRREELARVRTPLLLLTAFAGLIALQLVPLPPDLWLSLPGRARFAEAAEVARIAQPWRPLTLTPDLAWSSLMALVPAFAALIALGMMRERHRAATVPMLIIGASASIFVAILQITGGATSPAYLYKVTHEGSAVGLFANRNHQAAFLAATFVLLRVWTLAPARLRERAQLRGWLAIVFALVLVPLVFVTGSRAGLMLALVGIAAAVLVQPRAPGRHTASPRVRAIAGAFGAALIGAVAYMVFFSTRSESLQRLAANDLQAEVRFRNTSLVVEIIGDFLPWGAGFGSFDRVFRIYEPDVWLGPTYYNRAHNDLLELALTGGIPALLLLALFVAWLIRRGVALVRAPADAGPDFHRARGGLGVVLIVLLASLVDYPLRTPLMASVFAFAVGWIALCRPARPAAGPALAEPHAAA